MAKYGEDFKESVVHDLRATNDSISGVARRHGIAPSTVVRWDAQFADRLPPPSVALDPDEQLGLDMTDVLDRLGRETGDLAWLRRIEGHNRRVAVWGRVYDLVGGLLGLSVLAALGLGYLGLYTTAKSPTSAYVIWTVVVVLAAVLVSAALDRLFTWLSSWFRGSFVLATLHLFRAEQLLANDALGELHEPRIWHVRARVRRRRLRSCLRKAEAVLIRGTSLGRNFRTTGARGWELAHRRKIAGTIAYVETILELEGVRAYERGRHLLRQVACLTILRDWSLTDLPVLPDTPARYQSPLRRVLALLWLPVPILGLIATPIVAVHSLWPLIEKLR